MNNDNGQSLGSMRRVHLEELVVPFTGFWGSDESSADRKELLVLGVGNVTNEGELDLKGATKRYLRREEMGGVAETGDLLVVKSSGSDANCHMSTRAEWKDSVLKLYDATQGKARCRRPIFAVVDPQLACRENVYSRDRRRVDLPEHQVGKLSSFWV